MLLNEKGKEDKLIGQNMFMRTSIKADDGRNIPIMTMGPICIKNEYKRKGYGKILLDYSLEKAAELGCGALCFEGNIDFYGKSGFRQASEYGIRYHGLPEGEDASFFLCKELVPGYLDRITGEYATPEGYLIDIVEDQPTEEANEDTVDNESQEDFSEESEEENPESSLENEDYPGEDVVEITNLQGETTTVYKLVDGRYMDRTNTVYIYDGKDTWTDTNGVEWNREVK